MTKMLHGKRFIDALLAAGIVAPEDRVSRVIIDARADNVVTVHIERCGDERLLQLVRSLDGIEIKRDEARAPVRIEPDPRTGATL